jgi:hypothetical protein
MIKNRHLYNLPGVKASILFTFVLLWFLPAFAGEPVLHKIGQWGGGGYRDVFVKGDYAYCAAGEGGLDIIHISGPGQPVKTSHVDMPGQANAVFVKGNYAYVANYGAGATSLEGAGLHVIDITNPSFPVTMGYYFSKRMRTVFVQDQYAYALAGDVMLILDISNRYSPVKVSEYRLTYDNPPYFSHYFAGMDIHVQGDYAYVAENREYGLDDDDYSYFQVIDVSNPAKPKRVGEFPEKFGPDGEYPTAIHVSGKYAYLLNAGNLKIVDIFRPGAPQLIGVCRDCGTCNLFEGDVKVQGGYAYIASGSVLEIVDISNPRAPSVAARYGENFAYTRGETGVRAVFVEGNRAFLAASSSGLRIIGVTRPETPVKQSVYDISGRVKGMDTDGRYLYLARQAKGLQVIDTSRPASPVLVGASGTPLDAWDVAVSGGYAYVASPKEGLSIFDLSNPAAPVKTGTWKPASGRDVKYLCVNGNMVCAATWFDGFYLVDVSDPSAPVEMGHWASFAKYVGVAIHGDYVFFPNRYAGKMEVIDISDPSAPVRAGEYNMQESGKYIAGMALSGNYAFIALEHYGLLALDISDPTNPKETGRLQTPGSPNGIYVSGDTAYLADGEAGVRVIDISRPAAPVSLAVFDTSGLAAHIMERDGIIYVSDEGSGIVSLLKLFDRSISPEISIDREGLSYSVETGGSGSPPLLREHSFAISNSGGGQLQWTASADRDWLSVSPGSGSGSGRVSVSVDTAGLAPGNHYGAISVSDPLAINSPRLVPVLVRVYTTGGTSAPFGVFETPSGENTVYGSVPLTGWALDDMGIQSVQIFRKEGRSMVYVGDAYMVDGARPDVETRYPWYPFNYKAGWGYLLLTNTLPGGGNGEYTFYAVATDIEGNEVFLGSKDIPVDNANAEKPFGTIDTPESGQVVTGGRYIQSGWALTPPPHTIPFDGSTITVWVDGQPIGHPQYNVYRKDIAALFPGYANSGGAVGHFFLDATAYENGLHTIAWSVEDDAGHREGIGSRYFWIENDTGPAASGGPIVPIYGRFDVAPEWDGRPIEVRELEVVRFALAGVREGYLKVGETLRPLPPGATLDTANRIFAWQPGPGVKGAFSFVFHVRTGAGQFERKLVDIIVLPKF